MFCGLQNRMKLNAFCISKLCLTKSLSAITNNFG